MILAIIADHYLILAMLFMQLRGVFWGESSRRRAIRQLGKLLDLERKFTSRYLVNLRGLYGDDAVSHRVLDQFGTGFYVELLHHAVFVEFYGPG
jgi:hypothetical protein